MGFHVRRVPEAKLGRSEPAPWMFGNPENEKAHPKWSNKNWLTSRFHFSFAEYHNPANMGFGCVRVMNDDLVQPKRGFGEHPHRDMEIATYIVDGYLTHRDSMGTDETLERGAIQFMTAGTGVQHQEHNLNEEHPLRFIQIWIQPRTHGLKPNYGSATGDCAKRTNQWAHLVSDVKDKSHSTPIKLNQDVNLSVTELSDETKSVPLSIPKGRMAYMLCVEGTATIAGSQKVVLQQYDAAEIQGPTEAVITGKTHVLLLEMAQEAGSGRRDI